MSNDMGNAPPTTSMLTEDQRPEERVWCLGTDCLAQVGHYSLNMAKSRRPCFHREWEIQYIHRGQGSTFIGGTVYRFQKGCALIVHTDEIHNDIFEQDTDFESTEIRFLPQVVRGRQDAMWAIDILASHHWLDLSEKDSVSLKFHLKAINEEYEMRRPHWEGSGWNHLENVLILLARTVVDGSPQESKELHFSPKIVAYVEQHLHSRLSLQEAARDLGVCMFSLSRMFKRYVGIGFQEYIIHRRMADAKALLENTDLKVEAIARRVGFADISTFYRNFRLATGLSPREYRKLFSQPQ